MQLLLASWRTVAQSITYSHSRQSAGNITPKVLPIILPLWEDFGD